MGAAAQGCACCTWARVICGRGMGGVSFWNDTELTAEIAAANGSMREVMSRVKRLARRKQSASKV